MEAQPEREADQPGHDIVRRWQRELPTAIWLAGLVLVAGWVALQVIVEGMTHRDEMQQYSLVQSLARLHLRGAMGGVQGQTAPPGYGIFALPFHALFQRFTPDETGYVIAGWVALAILAAGALLALREVGVPRRSPLELLGVAAVAGGTATIACYTEAYHPGDVLAGGCVLLGAVAAVQQRWAWAAVALGCGLLSKQWVIVAIAVLAAILHGKPRAWVVLGPAVIAVLVILPFFITGPKLTMNAITAGGTSATYRTIWAHISWLRFNKRELFVEGRELPLVALIPLCVWLNRSRPRLEATVVFTALAVGLMIRPLFDPAGYDYYLAPGMAMIAVSGRSWRWPAFSIAAAASINWLQDHALRHQALLPAVGATAVMAAVFGSALVHLRAEMRGAGPLIRPAA